MTTAVNEHQLTQGDERPLRFALINDWKSIRIPSNRKGLCNVALFSRQRRHPSHPSLCWVTVELSGVYFPFSGNF